MVFPLAASNGKERKRRVHVAYRCWNVRQIGLVLVGNNDRRLMMQQTEPRWGVWRCKTSGVWRESISRLLNGEGSRIWKLNREDNRSWRGLKLEEDLCWPDKNVKEDRSCWAPLFITTYVSVLRNRTLSQRHNCTFLKGARASLTYFVWMHVVFEPLCRKYKISTCHSRQSSWYNSWWMADINDFRATILRPAPRPMHC